MMLLLFLAASCILAVATAFPKHAARAITIDVSDTADAAGEAVLESFVTYSIEFSSFPEFAGNLSSPNEFSNNLLNNLGEIQGTKPHIRVGGNTQDYALYNSSLATAINGTVIPERSPDYPYILYIGPSYYESYQTWPDVKFVHGFNLGKNDSDSRQRLVESVPLACKALSNDNLLYWTLGNEPDLFRTSAQGPVRPRNYDEAAYLAEWQNLTSVISDAIVEACPGLLNDKWYAPSFAGPDNNLDPVLVWEQGLNSQNKVALIDSHNYIGGATQPGVTLRGTLMNHTRTVRSVNAQVAQKNDLAEYNLPFILGETNSLYNQGAPGLSNAFGAALWGLDFNLYCASQGIRRVHMHQGTNYRYAAWQPVDTAIATKGTKPPYYASIAAATALGDITATDAVQVAHLPLPGAGESYAAYATYAAGTLQRLTVLNMVQWNYTGNEGNTAARPETSFEFRLPQACGGEAVVQRLFANGSDALSGVTFNGVSYNWELDNGRPVVQTNVTQDESMPLAYGGELNVVLPASSAAVIQLEC